jgi:hypothetical protein
MVTIPNSVNSNMRDNLKKLGQDGFQNIVKDVLFNLKKLLHDCPGAKPWFRGIQAHSPSQSAAPFVDARIEFDLRVAVQTDGPHKRQPRWLSAAYDSFVHKEGSNYRIAMGVIFPYKHCQQIQKETATDLIAAAWLACKPLVKPAR